MSQVISPSFQRSAIAGQLPDALGGLGEEQKQAVVEPLIDLIPEEMLHEIFSRLPMDQLVIVRKVCKLWHQIVPSVRSSLLQAFPEAPRIGPEMWERHIDLKQHGLTFETKGESGLIKLDDYLALKQMAAEVEPDPRVPFGISILVLPAGLTINKIIAFAKAPKAGNSTPFNVFDYDIRNLYGDQELKETITVVVTNGVFKKSRNLNVDCQEALVKKLKCDMPELLPFMANMILSFISSDPEAPVCFLGDAPWTYTRLKEKVNNNNANFGGFRLPTGPSVAISSEPYENFGVGGLRKFP